MKREEIKALEIKLENIQSLMEEGLISQENAKQKMATLEKQLQDLVKEGTETALPNIGVLPVDRAVFEDIIKNKQVYIDKTHHIEGLVKSGTFFFLSRPRRFGKSMLVNTLKAVFEGQQELFKGLHIYDKIEWQKYPVIHIDMIATESKAPDTLAESLRGILSDYALQYGVKLTKKNDKDRFSELIRGIARKTGKKVVVLIDEYDKPILDLLDTPEKALESREILRRFYSAFKAAEKDLRFVFLTGVTRFPKISIFSELNNLVDLSDHPLYSSIVGYTQQELEDYFSEWVDYLAQSWKWSREKVFAEIKNWYNGYSWDGKTKLYNPFSINRLFYYGEIRNFWFESGSPSFLIKILQAQEATLAEFDGITVDSIDLGGFSLTDFYLPTILYQTGYLTITDIKFSGGIRSCRLSYPNNEVRLSFIQAILKERYHTDSVQVSYRAEAIAKGLQERDLDSVFENLKRVFASISYNHFQGANEKYYHTVLYLVFSMVGITVETEVQTNRGRIDAVLKTKDTIYIMEFKMNSAEEAMDQIKNRKYYERYQGLGKTLILVGVAFSEKDKTIQNWISEEISDSTT